MPNFTHSIVFGIKHHVIWMLGVLRREFFGTGGFWTWGFAALGDPSWLCPYDYDQSHVGSSGRKQSG